MTQALLDAARRFAETHADPAGVARTPIPGLTIIRETMPGLLQYAVNRPLVAMLLQGRKRVTMGSEIFDFGAGESLLITTDVPTISQITRASAGTPYFSIVFDLDPAVIEGLVMEMGAAPFAAGQPVRVDPTEGEVADAALRLLRLLDRPASVPILQGQLVRELHYWLLSGRHGAAIRSLGVADSHAQRIGRAVAVIRADFAKPLRMERLAEVAGMSPSTFHEHFRAITSLSPLQLQKQLRLIEARRMLLSDGATIGHAAHAVGYESVPQFTREYGRMFGLPPARDLKAVKTRLQAAA
ncbi:AraC family transcriptional regulator [Rhizorhabdus dicambivorans]|uniref:AraC family transcriptional regulator n=1 Tax=Rhizorhabdus dicambivorans TaxID=1850238 RepID=A0A2A4FSY1_9SPHN|nr:AraC family transcriptional regulator [Rhizorhabdus dicambivorans]ATE64393.1 AraC family transcriptional regulator [Rhizorhabdus dicambivorans]PCE41259.1 AraC family transcriptional regulator [Rhizorhabdus dicambivorans]